MTTDVPAFFVPFNEPEDFEAAYAKLAAAAGANGAPAAQRIYSLEWATNGETWTATVGETLRGIRVVTKGRGRERREVEVPTGTSDVVLAIFEHAPFLVAHNGCSGVWNFPILTHDKPRRVVKFSAEG